MLLVSCERLGDLDSAAGQHPQARDWYVKEVDAARRRYSLEPSAASLNSPVSPPSAWPARL